MKLTAVEFGIPFVVFLLSSCKGVKTPHPPPTTASKTPIATRQRVGFIKLPFLGRIAVRARSATVPIRVPGNKKLLVPVQSYSTAEGVLVRIEFLAPGPEPFQWPLAAVENTMRGYGEKPVGLMTKPPAKSLEALLEAFATQVDLSKAKKWNLTLIMMSNALDEPAIPVAILNVWGAVKGWPDLPDVPESLRLRCIYHYDTGVISMDDVL